jgi:hypothetical protein
MPSALGGGLGSASSSTATLNTDPGGRVTPGSTAMPPDASPGGWGVGCTMDARPFPLVLVSTALHRVACVRACSEQPPRGEVGAHGGGGGACGGLAAAAHPPLLVGRHGAVHVVLEPRGAANRGVPGSAGQARPALPALPPGGRGPAGGGAGPPGRLPAGARGAVPPQRGGGLCQRPASRGPHLGAPGGAGAPPPYPAAADRPNARPGLGALLLAPVRLGPHGRSPPDARPGAAH